MAYVYILRSDVGRNYIGSALYLGPRLRHHRGGFTPSTKRLKAFKLVFAQKYPTLKQARAIERRLKKLKRKDYIEKIVRDGVIKTGM